MAKRRCLHSSDGPPVAVSVLSEDGREREGVGEIGQSAEGTEDRPEIVVHDARDEESTRSAACSGRAATDAHSATCLTETQEERSNRSSGSTTHEAQALGDLHTTDANGEQQQSSDRGQHMQVQVHRWRETYPAGEEEPLRRRGRQFPVLQRYRRQEHARLRVLSA